VTLASCVERVLEVVDATAGEVVLVAHSRNGIVASQAAEQRPDRIHGLVYVAAYLLPSGTSMVEYAALDPESLVVRNLHPPFDPRRAASLARVARSSAARWLLARLLPVRLQTHSLDRAVYKEALYEDCADEITELAHVLLEPEPNWPGLTPLRLSDGRYGRVPKVYVECAQDRAVTLPLQRRMLKETPCDRVFSLASSHSPFFSRPADLVDILVASLETFAAARGRPAGPVAPWGRGAPSMAERSSGARVEA
jgi:pimeloyl-ACP methyl ester carboxylesterase